MRVLGIDPGIEITGYGLIEERGGRLVVLEAGSIRTSRKSDVAERLKKIYCGIDGLIRELRPDVLALEKLYSHYKHPASVIMMGHARGVICLLAGLHSLVLVHYPATKIKKAVTGNGLAGKVQVRRMVTHILGLSSFSGPDDVSDALAVAISHCYHYRKSALFSCVRGA